MRPGMRPGKRPEQEARAHSRSAWESHVLTAYPFMVRERRKWKLFKDEHVSSDRA
jgi:hypothetical protein